MYFVSHIWKIFHFNGVKIYLQFTIQLGSWKNLKS